MAERGPGQVEPYIPKGKIDGAERTAGALHSAAGGEAKRSILVNWKDELQRFEEFGLGRGVDVMDPSPFANKKSLEVLPISIDTIICTDEGGAYQSICQNLETSDTNTIQLALSTTVPKTPIQIGAAVEYSRRTTQRGYTIGRKVITRSVEFRKEVTADHEPKHSIENSITKPLDACNKDEKLLAGHVPKRSTIITQLEDCSKDENQLVKLISELRITHYVSKIQLGAAEYCTTSEEYYSSFVKGKANVGVDKIAELTLSESQKLTRSSQITEIKRIGLMNDKGVVERGTYMEAVVDVQLESIANLVKSDLRDAVTKALRFYITARSYCRIGYRKTDLDSLNKSLDEDETDGKSDVVIKIRQLEPSPTQHEETQKYAICCCHEKEMLFLDRYEKINPRSIHHPKAEVVAWKMNEAKKLYYFNLRCTESPGEFIIMDYSDFGAKSEMLHKDPDLHYDFWPTPSYLKVNTRFGYNHGPLSMENSVDEYHCRLTLRPRLFRKHSHVTMSDFTNGKDMFYICTSNRRGRTGYLYVRDRGRGKDVKPEPASEETKGTDSTGTKGAAENEETKEIDKARAENDREQQEGIQEDQAGATNKSRSHISSSGGTGTKGAAENGEANEVDQTGTRNDQAQQKDDQAGAANESRSPVSGPNEAGNGSGGNREEAAGARPRARYVLACKPSIKRGDSDELMLFRLVRFENMYIAGAASVPNTCTTGIDEDSGACTL